MTDSLLRRRRDQALFAVAVVANLVMLYWPHVHTPGGVPHIDKIAHALSFAALAWTGRRAGIGLGWLLGALAAHAVVSEVAQHLLLPGRGGDPADVAADVIGVGLGLLGGTWRHERVGDERRRVGRRVGRAAAGRQPRAR